MSEQDTTKYLQNRSLWQKSATSFRRQKPRALTFIDGTTWEVVNLDIAKITRARNPYRVDKSAQGAFIVDIDIGEYEEGLVTFSDEVIVEYQFNNEFSGRPTIVLTPENDPSGSYNVFATDVTSASFQVGSSVEFTGQVRYRAAWASSYPARVSSSFSSSFIVSAGTAQTPSNTDATFVGSFPTGILAPIRETRITPVFLGSQLTDTVDTNVAVINYTATNLVANGSISGNLSAPLSSSLNEIHYLTVLSYPILS